MKRMITLVITLALFVPSFGYAIGHSNNGHSNPGHNTPGYNGNNNNHGHNTPGYNDHNNPGHGSFHVSYELRQAHRKVTNHFFRLENIYSPYMSQRDVREFGRVLAQLSMELRMVIMEAPRRHRSELRQVREIVERARFSLLTENDVRRAHRQVSRAKDAYRSVTRQFNLF